MCIHEIMVEAVRQLQNSCAASCGMDLPQQGHGCVDFLPYLGKFFDVPGHAVQLISRQAPAKGGHVPGMLPQGMLVNLHCIHAACVTPGHCAIEVATWVSQHHNALEIGRLLQSHRRERQVRGQLRERATSSLWYSLKRCLNGRAHR